MRPYKNCTFVCLSILLGFLLNMTAKADGRASSCFNRATAEQVPYRPIKVREAGELSQCSSMECFEAATRQTKTFEITYYNLPEGDPRFGIYHGCLGFQNKCVAVGPDSDLYRFAAELIASGVYPDAFGDKDAGNHDIDSHWLLINEARCEYRKWCRKNVKNSRKRAICRTDFRRRGRFQRVYRGGVFRSVSDYVRLGVWK